MHYDGCDYLHMLGLKLSYVSKRGPKDEDAAHVSKSFCDVQKLHISSPTS